MATVADQRVHGTTHERPIERFARETLTPLGARAPYRYEREQVRRVPADALVAIGAARYSVPVQYVGRTVTVQETATHYALYDGRHVYRTPCEGPPLRRRHGADPLPGLVPTRWPPTSGRAAAVGSGLPAAGRGHGPGPRPLRGGGRGRRWRMSTPQLERLHAYCHQLRLYQVETELPTLLEQAAKHERSYSEFLEDLLSREIHAKGAKHLAMRLAMARFPFQKTLESFEFKFQPSIDPKVVRELATGRYLEHGENVSVARPAGRGQDASGSRLGDEGL